MGRVFLAGMFFATFPLAIAQQTAPKSYHDAAAGVTFKLPPGSKLDTTGTEGTMMMPETADGGPGKPHVAFTYESSSRAKTKVHGLVFAYATLPATDLTSCAHLFQAEESSDPPESVTIAGTEFLEFSFENDGMCHERRDTVDLTFARGQCLAFERETNASCLPLETDKGRALALSELSAADEQLERIMQSVRIDGASSPSATYEDSEHGVSFQYPASWKREAMRAGQLGGEILPVPNEKAPFYGTNIVSPVGYFRYRVVPGLDIGACSRKVQYAIHDQDSPPHSVLIDGVRFHAIVFDAPVTGQSFEGTVYWALRHGDCYLFETDMFTHPTPPDASPSLVARRKRVQAEY